MQKRVERARKKYKPEVINFLLVAEAPPAEESGRFFYFENVDKQDSLFLETMKVLYPHEYNSYPDVKSVRSNKAYFLEKFKNDGFYLVDSVEEPMEEGISSRKKERIIALNLPFLTKKLKKLALPDTKVILISSTVYNACVGPLTKAGLNIINSEMIEFPGSGGQVNFRNQFGRLLRNYNW